MKKIKYLTALWSFLLGIGIFLLPITVYAQNNEGVKFSGNTIRLESVDELSKMQRNPFASSGQATVVDNATEDDGKEFYTFTTPDENIFYLVIDRQRDSENVYLLNAVTEEDLSMLAQSAKTENNSVNVGTKQESCSCQKKCITGEVNVLCQVCSNNLSACMGKEAEQTGADKKETEIAAKGKKQSGKNTGTVIFVIIAVITAGSAGYYFKIYRPKRELDEADDLEDLLDSNPTVNEDDEASNNKDDAEEEKNVMLDYDDYPYDDFSDNDAE